MKMNKRIQSCLCLGLFVCTHTCAISYSYAANILNKPQFSQSEKWADASGSSIHFTENKGQIEQTDGKPAPYVGYLLERGNTSIYLLKSGGIAYQFNRMHYPDGYRELLAETHEPGKLALLDTLQKKVRLETYRMDMQLVGANPEAKVIADGKSSDYAHYYTHDALFVHHYRRLTYKDIYPGIDWVVYTTPEGGLKYDFVVHPFADPSQIKIDFSHQEELYLDENGNLIHSNRLGRFTEQAPISFQHGQQISSRFLLKENVLSFELEGYDPSQSLTIDPNRIWATYYGGSGVELSTTVDIDVSGNVYISGSTTSSVQIASAGHQIVYGGFRDAYLVKLSSSGSRIWSTYFGGKGVENAYGCKLDGSGNIYLCGSTTSKTGIALGGFKNSFVGTDTFDAYLAKFNSSGIMQWGTYYGGEAVDIAVSCAVDPSGNIYLAGYTESKSSIAFNGYQNSFVGGPSGTATDAFLVKFSSTGTRLWATYYGGNGFDHGASCATDLRGNVYLAGITASDSGLAKGNYQNSYGGGWDAFLVKFSGTGSLLWATYFGGSNREWGMYCTTDTTGNVFLTGMSRSTSGIAWAGYKNTISGLSDAFLAKFTPIGNRDWATYFGGADGEFAYHCATDRGGNIYMSGYTQSNSGVAVVGHQTTYGGGTRDAFLAKFNQNSSLQWSTYYGGSADDFGSSSAVDDMGNIYLAGYTNSTNDISINGYQNTYGGGEYDAFIVKFGSGSTMNSPRAAQGVSNWLVYPNPNHGKFIIQNPGYGTFDLFEIAGKLLYTYKTNNEKEIQVNSSLPSGIYIIRERNSGTTTILIVEL